MHSGNSSGSLCLISKAINNSPFVLGYKVSDLKRCFYWDEYFIILPKETSLAFHYQP